MRCNKFSELIVASTRYLSITVMDTMVTFSGFTVAPSRPISPSSQRHVATGFAPGRRAAFKNPCGVNHMSNCQRSASKGRAAIGSPSVPS